MHLKITLLLMLSTAVARAETLYRCDLSHGETVLLAKTTLKAGVVCPNCEDPSASIPEELIDAAASGRWNDRVRADPVSPPKLKRIRLREPSGPRRWIFLETRYLRSPAGRFQMKVNCPEGAQGGLEKCAGSLAGITKADWAFTMPAADERRRAGAGRVALSLTDREYLNLLVRLEQSGLPPAPGAAVLSPYTVSGSGELKLFREDPLFIVDVGLDERLKVLPELETRLAAFEIQIRCERLKAVSQGTDK